ncbi:MAG: anthranilate phosphoribosyltransferase [Candidatus Diapherotrites archaeon]|nr:anthranilate phosphoribosyltransferase [Candidatus Diapherotrites archaeon]
MVSGKVMGIEEASERVSAGNDLTRAETRELFDEIMRGKVPTEPLAAFLKALAEKGESIEEIIGAAESMRAVVACVKPKVKGDLLDIVGTGGDKKNSFNVSTCAAFVAAGAGCIVAKHGNRSVSSKCGAADVLEKLGVKIDLPPEKNAELLEKIGIAFLFAPCHHPAMRHAMPARKMLGTRTIFNILGPLTNPAGAQTYLLGVFDLSLAEKLASALAKLRIRRALVVHGRDGFDEISLCAPTAVFDVAGGKVGKYEIAPEKFGLKNCAEAELGVAGAEESAEAIKNILCGKEKGAKMDIVLINAGAAIYANGMAESIAEGIELARKSIESGAAMEKLKALVELSNA